MLTGTKTHPLSAHKKPIKKNSSVQNRYVGLREVRQCILCLSSTIAASGREYRAVLEVDGINYLLKSEEEQLVITDLYQLFLSSLTHALQVLMRVTPLDLSRYVRHLTLLEAVPESAPVSLSHGARTTSGQQTVATVWRDLAASQLTFLQQLASQRTLLERRFYLIVPADSDLGEEKSIRQTLGFGLGKRTWAMEYERARQQLELRCGEITRQLNNMGLGVRRLDNQELVRLYYSCMTPKRALRYPLPEQVIEGIQRPIQLTGHQMTRGAALSERDLIQLMQRLDQQEKVVHRQSKGKKTSTIAEEAPMNFTHLADVIAPQAIYLQPDAICIEQEYARTLVVRAMPRFVTLGWLRPLCELDEPMDVCFYYSPRHSGSMIRQLVRKRTEYHSSAMNAQRKGNLLDPDLAVAEGDVEGLIARLASGEERMLDFSLYVQVRGSTVRELEERTDRVMSILANMLVVARSAVFEQDIAFRSCLPECRNLFGATMLLDSSSAAFAAFPFMSNSLFMAEGIMEGLTPSGEPVILDWWSPKQRNANRLIVAPTGSGKSYKSKLDVIRMFLKYAKGSWMQQELAFQAIVIDPEREYRRLCVEFKGQWVRLAPGSGDHINPFDLPRPHVHDPYEDLRGDRLSEKIAQLHTLLDIMLADRGPGGVGTLTSREKGLLDRALIETYRKQGITADPSTHHRTPPLMRDLYEVLASEECGPDATSLTLRLRRYVEGSLAGIFAGHTNVELNNSIVVFDVHDLDTELRPIGFFLISNHVWTASFGSTIPRQLVVDELLSLYQYPEGARFLETLFQRARKHYLGVTGITQHPVILQKSTIPSNCAVQILMAQEPASLDLIAETFKLSPREMQLLKMFGKGDALLLTSEKRIIVHFEASELEHRLATTDPRELASWEHAGGQPQGGRMGSSIIQTLHSGNATTTNPLTSAAFSQFSPPASQEGSNTGGRTSL